MFYGVEISKNYCSGEDEKPYPKGKFYGPVTPHMLVKALRRLNKNSFKRVIFTPREVTCEILRTYPEVEQDCQALLIEVSDKLACGAAAGILGTKQDLGYFAYELRNGEAEAGSELMFWIFYKKILKKRTEEMNVSRNSVLQVMAKKRDKRKKMLRFSPFTKANLTNLPIAPLQRRANYFGRS